MKGRGKPTTDRLCAAEQGKGGKEGRKTGNGWIVEAGENRVQKEGEGRRMIKGRILRAGGR